MNPKDLLDNILRYITLEHFSDIHINTNSKINIRNKTGEIDSLDSILVDGVIFELPIFDNILVNNIIKKLIGERGFEIFDKEMEFDSSYMVDGGDRYRVNCYMDTKGNSIAIRRIPNTIPTLKELGFGDQVVTMLNKSKGLILITGPTGAGKSTNLAAMIDYINNNFKKHIITIEDPVEFAFISNKSLINQRELGNQTKGFHEAIRASLREDPDVIMVGEMRDPETIKAAITLAETGHLVLSTLHTNDSVQTIDRIVDVFPSVQQKQIRMQLAMNLVGVVSQRLLTRADLTGRVAAREILITNDAVKNLIITGKTHQLYSVLEVGQKQGMILMDKYLHALYDKQIITKDTLMSYVRDKEGMEMMID